MTIIWNIVEQSQANEVEYNAKIWSKYVVGEQVRYQFILTNNETCIDMSCVKKLFSEYVRELELSRMYPLKSKFDLIIFNIDKRYWKRINHVHNN